MKKFLFLLLGVVILTTACQTNTELTDADKDSIVQAVKQASQEYWSIMASTYDSETYSKAINFIDENSDQIWQTEPVASVTGIRIRYKRSDSFENLKSMFDDRLESPTKINNAHYSVLSKNKVLEVMEGEFTVIRKDSTNVGTFAWIGTTLWANIDGEWKIQYAHNSYARQSE